MLVQSDFPDQPKGKLDAYAMEDTGELFLMEGADAQAWLDKLEAEKYVLEETSKY